MTGRSSDGHLTQAVWTVLMKADKVEPVLWIILPFEDEPTPTLPPQQA